MKYLIWDFDGTLGYRQGGMWSAALLEILRQANPGHEVRLDQIRPYLQTGLPWHTPEQPHTEIQSSGQWWDALDRVFERAFLGIGICPDQARLLARQVRRVYPDPAAWRLFEDVLPTLTDLSARGWKHLILSNHVPELRQIIHALGLDPYISCSFNSAETGYEKPHPQAFLSLLGTLEDIDSIWMIGDNLEADILGAQAAGLRGILVRGFHKGARYYCETLTGIPKILSTLS
jgi:putative hydrolase of the HAD superfamily